MIILKHINDISTYLLQEQKNDKNIGFVPTMGALHEGHMALINSCKQQNDITVCSIFVNPTQFNNPKDFEKYPITIDKDIQLLGKNNCDVLFLPSTKEIYPDEIVKKTYNLGYLESILEGKYRPGHFQGVCQVMERLLDIIKPQQLYLGQKDYQQCMIINKLIGLLKIDIEINIIPTIREINGLAMSSRNMRLGNEGRNQAFKIFETLHFIKSKLQIGSLQELKSEGKKYLQENGFVPDYVEIADANDLSLLESWDGSKKLVALVAATLNEVRLIDNMLLN